MKLSLEASSAAENVAVAPPSHSLSSPSRSSNPGGSAGCACVMCPMLRVPEIIVSAPAVRQNGRSWTHGVANKRHDALIIDTRAKKSLPRHRMNRHLADSSEDVEILCSARGRLWQ